MFLVKKIKSLEAVLAGALRTEQVAESSLKKSAAQMEHLTRLVKQREEETQCCKMILRFREDILKRMETLSDGCVASATYPEEERNAILKELQLVWDGKGCNPEVTKFAMESMHLQEQLRKFQDFHTSGEREAMAQEISDIRDQLADVLDSKLSLESLSHAQKDASVVELAAERHQLGLLRIEAESYQRELEGCRMSLNACLTSNNDMGRQLDELQKQLEISNELCDKYKKDLQDVQNEDKSSKAAIARSQLKDQPKETLQENDNLQTKLQVHRHRPHPRPRRHRLHRPGPHLQHRPHRPCPNRHRQCRSCFLLILLVGLPFFMASRSSA